MSKYEALFTPLKVGGVTIKNRFVQDAQKQKKRILH